MSKKHTGVYLSNYGQKKLEILLKETGMNQSQLIEEAISRYYDHYRQEMEHISKSLDCEDKKNGPKKAA